MELEVELDKFLRIKTNGRDDSKSNFVNYPYEPTPYMVLQNLSNSGYITKKDLIIDYGCGKGRVSFYLAKSTKAKMIGIEYDERLYNSALDNHKNSIASNRVSFILSCASQYKFPLDATGAYFFNPFSIDILKEVIKRIKESQLENPRTIKLFFYYPSKEYLSFLNSSNEFKNLENIDCKDIFKEVDNREIIAVYTL